MNESDRLFAKFAPDPMKGPFRTNSFVPIARTAILRFVARSLLTEPAVSCEKLFTG
jgi:hypothetical protein